MFSLLLGVIIGAVVVGVWNWKNGKSLDAVSQIGAEIADKVAKKLEEAKEEVNK